METTPGTARSPTRQPERGGSICLRWCPRGGGNTLGKRRGRSLRQVRSGLLSDDVRGVPRGPFLAAHPLGQLRLEPMPCAFLVLAVGGLGTPKRTLQIRGGCEGRAGDPAGEPRRDLLDNPHIAVGVVEGRE